MGDVSQAKWIQELFGQHGHVTRSSDLLYRALEVPATMWCVQELLGQHGQCNQVFTLQTCSTAMWRVTMQEHGHVIRSAIIEHLRSQLLCGVSQEEFFGHATRSSIDGGTSEEGRTSKQRILFWTPSLKSGQPLKWGQNGWSWSVLYSLPLHTANPLCIVYVAHMTKSGWHSSFLIATVWLKQ